LSEPHLPLRTILAEWGRIGVTGFGGPPAHITLLRRLCVVQHEWLSAADFEAALSACNLLPGPASTQLSIFCAYRMGGRRGAVVGGLAFIVPAVVIVLGLSVLFLAESPPLWVAGAGAGAGAAVAPIAVTAALGLIGPSWSRARELGSARRARWAVYVLIGAAGATVLGQLLVLALLACGATELIVVVRRSPRTGEHADGRPRGRSGGGRATLQAAPGLVLLAALAAAGAGGIGALAWESFKVGALSYGGGFVIIPLMRTDAVHTYHWMTSAEFLNAVALGQVSPGPVVATVAAVGYAAHGVLGGVLASIIAFAPSFVFVLLGGARFERLRESQRAQGFIDGAGPAAIGAILGASIPLAAALSQAWQFALLAAAGVALLVGRRGVVETLLAAGAVGVIAALAGAPVS
jgi:chromate transporter